MPANPALTGTEQTNLLLEADVPAKLSYKPDIVLAYATVSVTPTYPCLTISVSSPSAGWIGSHTDKTCKIVSAGGVLRGYYRLTATPTSNTCKIAEITGDADGGLFADGNRTTSITSGDTIYILDRRDIDERKLLIDSTGIILQDGATQVGDYNTVPEPICNITLNGEAGDFATQVSSGNVHIIAVATVTRWAPSVSGGSTLIYAWTAPSAATNVTGQGTNTLEFDLPSGDVYEIELLTTDSIGHSTESSRTMWLHNNNYLPVAIKIPASDDRDRTGRKTRVIGPRAILGAIPIGGKCLVWGAATWGGNDVPTASKKISGFMISRPYSHEPGYFESQADIVGPMGILALRKGYGITLQYTGSQTTWNELAADLSNAQFVMWWILRWRAANVLRCFDFTPLSTSNLTGRRKDFTIAPMSIAAQLQTLAKRIDSNIGARSDGGFIHKALPWMLDDRSGLVTRDTLTNDIYQRVDVDWQPEQEVTAIQVSGYYSNLASDTAVTAMAPGEVSEPSVINDKIYESPTDAQLKVGQEFARAKNPYKRLTVYIPVNRDVYEPVDMERVPVVIPSDKSPDGTTITLTGIPDKVSKVWIEGRRAALRMECDVETNGKAGIYIPPPAQVTTPTTYNTAPAVATQRATGTTFDGYSIFAHDTAHIGFCADISAPVPNWIDYSASGLTGIINQMRLDPFSSLLNPSIRSGPLGAWVSTTTGLFYKADLFNRSLAWTQMVAYPNTLILLRPSSNVPGVITVLADLYIGGQPNDVFQYGAYGATTLQHFVAGEIGIYGLDIDSFGANEILAAGRDGAGLGIYQSVGGGAASVKFSVAPLAVTFVQKPVLMPDGSANSGTGNREYILYCADAEQVLYKTLDGGITKTDITPPGGAYVAAWANSIAATDDSKVLAVYNQPSGALSISFDAGDSWPLSPGGPSGIQTLGFFPRQQNGSWGLYLGTSSRIIYSPDLATTQTDVTGDWASSIGAIVGPFQSVIPLY
jgi:hypothetical protein